MESMENSMESMKIQNSVMQLMIACSWCSKRKNGMVYAKLDFSEIENGWIGLWYLKLVTFPGGIQIIGQWC